MVMIKIIMMLLQNQLKTLKLLNYLFSFLSRKSLLKKKKMFLILTKIPKLII